MLKEHEIVLSGGMNSDDDDKSIPTGDYRNLVNLRAGISGADNEGMAESMKSPLLSTIDWKGTTMSNGVIVGSAIDRANDKAYLFFDGVSNGYSIVVEYIISAGVGSGESIFEDRDDKLNISVNNPITNARVFNGNIYWTDNSEQPMFLNIARAKVFMANNYNSATAAANWDPTVDYDIGDHVLYGSYVYKCYSAPPSHAPPGGDYWWTKGALISETYIPGWDIDNVLFIATPPVDAPQVVYQSDSRLLTNNLRNTLYQFAYRYIYFDYRKSVFGPASLVPVPEQEETYLGQANDDISTNNKLQITINTGTSSVVSIEVIFRNSKDWSTWYRMDIYEKFTTNGMLEIISNNVLIIEFYDDVAPLAVSDAEVYKPFHYVPQKAGYLEIVEGNNLVFGDCLEGYPAVTPIVTLEKKLLDISTVLSRINMNRTYAEGDKSVSPYEAVMVLTLPYRHYPGSRYNIKTINLEDGELNCHYDLSGSADPNDYPLNVKNGLIAAAQAAGMDWVLCEPENCIPCNDYSICFFPVVFKPAEGITAQSLWAHAGASVEGWIDDNPETYIPKHPNMKEGASHGVGMVYYDEQRRAGPVVVDKNMRFYLDYYQDDSGSGLLINGKRWYAELTINHLPPAWASYFQIVYTGNLSMSYWLQVKIYSIATQTDYLEINVNDTIDAIKNIYSNFTVGRYTFEAGDRMRVVGYYWGGVFYDWAKPFIDVEIIGTDPADEDKFRVQRFLNDVDLSPLYVVEIYRPKKTYDEDIFYEIANLKFDIKTTANGRVHGGDTDQVLTVGGGNLSGAIIILDKLNDGYKYKRNVGGTYPFFASSQHLSDYYRPSNFSSLGFPKIEDDTLEQRQMTNRYRYGGSLQLNTRNNQIADFEYDGYEDLPEKHGRINGLQEVGFVLKILQSHRVWSIYIRRTSSFNPDGTENIILIDRIFGTKRPDSQEWGTQNPESVMVHERHMYFWDRSQGRMIRDSANGLHDISSYKMRTFFRSIKDSVVEVRGGINESYEEIWFHLGNAPLGQGSGYSIIFNEKKNRWTHKTMDVVERFFNIGSHIMISNKNLGTKIYQLDAGADYNQFGYPSVINPIIEVVANPEPEAVKIFKGIIQHSTHKFFSPTVGDINIPPSENYPLGMETRLLESKVISQEGIFYGPVMMDNNTPMAGSTEAERIVDGRSMRGQALRILLTRDDETNERIVFEGAKVTYINSKRT